jgi:transcriptional regulator with PAS, ATPase and Fis domain
LERENRFWRQELMALFAGRESLTREDIPSEYLGKSLETPKSGREEPLSSLKRSRLQFERQCVRKALERAQGNQTLAAKSLGLHRNTLIWKLKELRLEAECRRIVRKRRGK